jgi:hypothetical protein
VLLKEGDFKNMSPPTKIMLTLLREDLPSLSKRNNSVMQDMKEGQPQASFPWERSQEICPQTYVKVVYVIKLLNTFVFRVK